MRNVERPRGAPLQWEEKRDGEKEPLPVGKEEELREAGAQPPLDPTTGRDTLQSLKKNKRVKKQKDPKI